MTSGYAPLDISAHLDNEEVIAEYLSAAAEDPNPDVLLAAIADVAKARGMAKVAGDAGLGRESLYKTLSPGAQPRYETIAAILRALNVRLDIKPFGSAGTSHDRFLSLLLAQHAESGASLKQFIEDQFAQSAHPDNEKKNVFVRYLSATAEKDFLEHFKEALGASSKDEARVAAAAVERVIATAAAFQNALHSLPKAMKQSSK